MSKSIKLVVDQLIHDLEHRPDDFICGDKTLVDSKSGLAYWIANTIFNGGIYEPYELDFGIYHSVRFHKALKKWKAARAIKLTTEV